MKKENLIKFGLSILLIVSIIYFVSNLSDTLTRVLCVIMALGFYGFSRMISSMIDISDGAKFWFCVYNVVFFVVFGALCYVAYCFPDKLSGDISDYISGSIVCLMGLTVGLFFYWIPVKK